MVHTEICAWNLMTFPKQSKDLYAVTTRLIIEKVKKCAQIYPTSQRLRHTHVYYDQFRNITQSCVRHENYLLVSPLLLISRLSSKNTWVYEKYPTSSSVYRVFFTDFHWFSMTVLGKIPFPGQIQLFFKPRFKFHDFSRLVWILKRGLMKRKEPIGTLTWEI